MSVWSLNSLSDTHSLPPRLPAACCDVTRSDVKNRDLAPLLVLSSPTCHWALEERWTTPFGLPFASPLGVPAGLVIITELLNDLHSHNCIDTGTVEAT